MRIIPLQRENSEQIQQTARLLFESFRQDWPDAWPDMDTALREVLDSLDDKRISLVAVDDAGQVLGWIGGIPMYDGNVWELHPLVVRESFRNEGIGRSLVNALEHETASRDGRTLWLGTDDENNLTTLGGADLYPDPLHHLASLQSLGNHPFVFYRKLGFAVTGVVPDANGVGKPDIYMAKRICVHTAGTTE